MLPSAFVQRSFPDANFPFEVRLVVELNGESQQQVRGGVCSGWSG